MPYLHYEKRCDQAEMRDLIKQISGENSQPQDPGEGDDLTQANGDTSSQNGCDDGAIRIDVNSKNSTKIAKSLSGPAFAESSSVANSAPDSEEGEEQRRFLCAENLIRGYLGSQGPLHVSNLRQALFSLFPIFSGY